MFCPSACLPCWHGENSCMENDEDMISKLPDGILHQILSSVDLKQAVQTSILSKRWIHLWATLPNLDFNFYRHGAISHGLSWSNQDDQSIPRFLLFVNQVLSHRDPKAAICKFRLTLCRFSSYDRSFVQKCIDYAVSHSVQDLAIDLYTHPKPIKFPQGLFASKSIRVLKLRQRIDSILVPKPFSLPSLKKLYLERFSFKDDDPFSFPAEPFSSFPDLEELTLCCCEVSGLTISAAKLRILKISFRGYNPGFSSESEMEKISAPLVTSFRLEGHVSLVCPTMDLPRLEEIYVDQYVHLEAPYTDDIKRKMPLNLIKILQQLGNAKSVTLTSPTILVLAMDPILLDQNQPQFPNAKYLRLILRPGIIDVMTSVPQNVMNYLVKGSSHGDSLVIEIPNGIE